jgi:formiminoglutamase
MKSHLEYFEFNRYSKEKIESLTTRREGETKLGEKLNYDFNSPECEYVILGISEDIGPQANLGNSGSLNAFEAFASRFFNIQSNRFFDGGQICVLGEVIQNTTFVNHREARTKIEILDDFVNEILQPIFEANKKIIIIGGGHNNAFPIIKACSNAEKKSIDVINLDPHADCRALEGRHSGNPFSYAKEKNYLNNYSVLGLHQNYNSEAIYTYLDNQKFYYTFFEDYLDKSRNLNEDLQTIIKYRDQSNKIGIEIDLDCLAFMPSSAYTPSGFSIEEVRNYIRNIAKNENISYIHLPEGAPQTENERKIVGKALSYFVSDFVKVNSKINHFKG